jgi:Nucleotide modification associated domain 2
VPRTYFYKLTCDDGGAPCVKDGLLSLAICKPKIRSRADKGDLIFGFAAKSLHFDNRLLYIARVTDKLFNGDYYTTGKFAQREDCVYQKSDGRFEWRPGSLHHGKGDLVHDLGRHPYYERANVLLCDDFRYFGKNGTADYKSNYPLIKTAVETLGQGHRVHHGEPLRQQLQAFMLQIWNEIREKEAGKRTSEPQRGACHRSRSCGILDEPDGL